jgi:hypothetical protein
LARADIGCTESGLAPRAARLPQDTPLRRPLGDALPVTVPLDDRANAR